MDSQVQLSIAAGGDYMDADKGTPISCAIWARPTRAPAVCYHSLREADRATQAASDSGAGRRLACHAGDGERCLQLRERRSVGHADVPRVRLAQAGVWRASRDVRPGRTDRAALCGEG